MRFRPLARRALRTARPPLVFIRSRNPWVRRRLIRLGWNVRFMTADPHSFIQQAERSGDTAHDGACLATGLWVYGRVDPVFRDRAPNSSTLPWEARELTRPVLDVSMRRTHPRSRPASAQPERVGACYSRDRNRGFVVPVLPACRARGPKTGGRQSQNRCYRRGHAPVLSESLSLLTTIIHFNRQISRKGRRAG